MRQLNKRQMLLEAVQAHGLQTQISKKTGIARSTVTSIFSGGRQATEQQAILLERYFIARRIPITRWDLLYFIPKGMPLVKYIERRVVPVCGDECESATEHDTNNQ